LIRPIALALAVGEGPHAAQLLGTPVAKTVTRQEDTGARRRTSPERGTAAGEPRSTPTAGVS
ncbi:hypothetical protein, partial [Streptomyces tibetensis]|uniref:hypothetical protein n=1 Tax=Streptomyces tibetensis TaxID=2382123 RepID=UPI0033F3B6FB